MTPPRLRPFRPIRKAVKRWRHRIAIQLGLAPRPADRGYMICCAQRSGSTYLCEILASTGNLGNPLEYFNTPARRRSEPGYPKNRWAQFDIVRTRGATRNGIYGVKTLANQLERVSLQADPLRELPNLKLIRLTRSNIINRAVSLARAVDTGQYDSSMKSRKEAVYSTALIRRCLESLLRQEAVWDRTLGAIAETCLTVDYEEILADPQAVTDRISAYLGVSAARVRPDLITLEMMRNKTSAEWGRRFLSETGDEFRHLADA